MHHVFEMVWPFLAKMSTIVVIAFIQNVSFTMVSRARNRSSVRYHLITAIGSNSLYLITLSMLVLSKMSAPMLLGYVIGTVTGSIVGAKISIRIEQWLNATSDDHLKPREMSSTERQAVWRELIRLTTDEEKRDLVSRLTTNA